MSVGETIAGRGLQGGGSRRHSAIGVAAIGPLALAALALYELATKVWGGDEQGHGPVILAVALWLIWQRRREVAVTPREPWPVSGWTALLVAAFAWSIGRSQQLIQLEVVAPLLAAVGLLLLDRGGHALRPIAVPLLSLLLLVPLPGVLVQTITMPLKIAVSQAAETLLHVAGYPVARSGVVLMVDRYQLLVADACAGLTSMFTLEAMGLLYVHLRGHVSRLRQAVLAVAIVPISFIANVVRVIILVLVTYHFGDAAGRGFLHAAAGVLLFAVAMMLVLAADSASGWVVRLGRRS